MGHGTSSNFWNSGNDGVRITVVDASSGTAVSSPLDFSNRTQKTSLLHFGKVNKLQYLGGAGLSLQSGVAYSCIRPTQSMPTIVSSKGQSNIEAIKRYFCSEYACMMVAQAAGVDYERMIAGEYKLLIEPIAAKVKASVMPAFAEGLEVRAAQLHNDAGMVGAVYYFRQTMEKE